MTSHYIKIRNIRIYYCLISKCQVYDDMITMFLSTKIKSSRIFVISKNKQVFYRRE